MARNTLSQSKTFVEFVSCVQGKSLFIGMDVHNNFYDIAILSSNGLSWACTGPAAASWIIELIEQHELDVRLVAYEAGPTGYSTARAFIAAGIECLVAAPAQIPRPASTGAKTDRLDCLRLARLAAQGMLHPVSLPTQEEEAGRDLVRRRHDLVKSLRVTKMRIRSRLLFWGVAEPTGLENWSRAALHAMEKLELSQEARRTLDSLLRELAFVREELRTVERNIAELCEQPKDNEVIRHLQTVPGVGPVVSATFRQEIFRPERFERSEELTKYLGLAPVPRQSGESKSRARLMPTGQKVLRSLLVEAAWRWKSADPWAQECYKRLLGKCGLAQKAICALARRLAIVLWRISIENRAYYPGVAAS